MIGIDIWLIPAHGAVGAGVGWGAALVAKNLAGLVAGAAGVPDQRVRLGTLTWQRAQRRCASAAVSAGAARGRRAGARAS